MEKETFSSIRFWAIGVLDSANEILRTAEAHRDNGDKMDDEHYLEYLNFVNKLVNKLGLLSFTISQLRDQFRQEESETETVLVGAEAR